MRLDDVQHEARRNRGVEGVAARSSTDWAVALAIQCVDAHIPN